MRTRALAWSGLALAALASLAAWQAWRSRAPGPGPTPPRALSYELPADQPRVLLLGDSISLAYYLPARRRLAGRVALRHPERNGGSSADLLASLEEWVGEERWDVIHFNAGLHDLKFCDASRRRVPVAEGRQLVPLERYRENLRALVARLRPRAKVLVWATTTPYARGVVGMRPEDHDRYAEAARAVMQAEGVLIDDLAAVVAARPELLSPDGIHPTAEGADQLSLAVVAAIDSALAQRE